MMDEKLLQSLATEMTAKFAVKIQINRSEKIYGGDINESYRVETNEGNWFVKLNNAKKYPQLFQREFVGLEALRATNTVAVPQPMMHGVLHDTAFLITEYIQKDAARSSFWEEFGQQLSQLHQHTKPFFGFYESNYIGTLKQYNTPYTSWPVFYAFNRLIPLARLAYDKHHMEKGMLVQIEALCKRLPQIFPDSPSSLLHGDLWSGNFMVGKSGAAYMYDPAIYYGHREMDLAMTRLFGGFDNRFYLAYQAAAPLAPGWQQRIGICQLYPLLVHYILFGGSYYNSIKEVLQGV
ncbi:fructosamine-3-kinase [Chitinophaga skermanii]|uniref:Fructosamine-3-kinase n=1 Tax=Chitinophaga skermanii TaxID=331697 RepID=A0A327QE72_9BACT|nr:fructosamine kinase family protein [Chitinophaga skermanii]RAJ02305.1 fructosamine-3-kinase [Chitinophaga skermanii]